MEIIFPSVCTCLHPWGGQPYWAGCLNFSINHPGRDKDTASSEFLLIAPAVCSMGEARWTIYSFLSVENMQIIILYLGLDNSLISCSLQRSWDYWADKHMRTMDVLLFLQYLQYSNKWIQKVPWNHWIDLSWTLLSIQVLVCFSIYENSVIWCT